MPNKEDIKVEGTLMDDDEDFLKVIKNEPFFMMELVGKSVGSMILPTVAVVVGGFRGFPERTVPEYVKSILNNRYPQLPIRFFILFVENLGQINLIK